MHWYFIVILYSKAVTVHTKLLHRSPHMSDRHCSIAEKFGGEIVWWIRMINPPTSLETFHNSINLYLFKCHMPPNILCKADYFWSINLLKRQNLNFKGFNFKKCKVLEDFNLTEIGVKIHVINWEGTEMLSQN